MCVRTAHNESTRVVYAFTAANAHARGYHRVGTKYINKASGLHTETHTCVIRKHGAPSAQLLLFSLGFFFSQRGGSVIKIILLVALLKRTVHMWIFTMEPRERAPRFAYAFTQSLANASRTRGALHVCKRIYVGTLRIRLRHACPNVRGALYTHFPPSSC